MISVGSMDSRRFKFSKTKIFKRRYEKEASYSEGNCNRSGSVSVRMQQRWRICCS